MGPMPPARFCSASAVLAGSSLPFSRHSRPASSQWKPVPAHTTGHERSVSWVISVRLMAPAYVKPFVKRQKNDAADAEAVCKAVQRPSMRFVPVKTEEQQANAI